MPGGAARSGPQTLFIDFAAAVAIVAAISQPGSIEE